MAKRIDFKELKNRLNFRAVASLYDVALPDTDKAQIKIISPFPGFEGERQASCSINLDRKIFNCFHSGHSGNVLEFALLMEGGRKDDRKKLREVALKLDAEFPGGDTPPVPASQPAAGAKAEPSHEKPVIVNAPLDFELENLDPDHPYMLGRGFTKETLAEFGAGYCSKGMMKERVAIPLHDSSGNLVGYAGRLVDDDLVTDENPAYRFPGDRDKKEAVYRFKKSAFVYNASRLFDEFDTVDKLVVVEGFTDCWWLHQNGVSAVVALMGWSCSDEQQAVILNLLKEDGALAIVTDGDEAGRRGAMDLMARFAPHRFVHWWKLEEGTQPTDYGRDELERRLG